MAADVFVSFGAQTDDLDAALATTKQKVGATTNDLNSLAGQMRATGATASSELGARLREACNEGVNAVDGLKSSFTRLAEIAGITLSANALKKFVEDTAKAGDDLDQEAARYGVALQDIQQLHGVADIGGASGTDLVSSLSTLETELRKSSDDATKTAAAFKAIGLSFDDMKGKSPLELLNLIAGAFSKYSDGVNKTAVANELLGDSGVKLIRSLDLGRQGFAEIEIAALRAGGAMSDATVDALAHTQRDLNEMKLAWNATMFAGLVPAVDVGIRAINRLIEAMDAQTIQAALIKIIDQFIEFGGKVAEATVIATAAWDKFVDHVVGGAPAFAAAVKGYADKTLDVMNDIATGGHKYVDPALDQLGVKLSEALEKVGLATKAQTQSWRNMANGVIGVAAAGEAAFGTLDQASIKTEFALQRVRDATKTARQEFDRLSGAVTTAHSDAAMGGTAYNGNAPIRPGNPKGPAAGVIPADSADSKDKTDNAAARAVMETYQAEVVAAQAAATEIEDKQNGLLQRHQITMAQWLAATLGALDREQDAIQDAADKAMASDKLNANQKTAIANREAEEMKRLAHEVAQDQEKAALDAQNAWKSGAADVLSAWNSNLRSLLSGTENFATALRKTVADLVLQLIEGFEKFAVNAVLQYLVINHAAGASAAVQVAANETAASGGMAALAANAVRAVTIDAGQTFAGVAAFLSPFLGPAALGPAAAAEATVMGAVASADIGMWNVPSDRLALVHHNELIMPAAQAGAFRDMLSNGGGGGGQNVSVHPSTHFHVSSPDAAGVAQFFRNNQRGMMRAVDEAVRHGAHLGLRRIAPA